MEKYLSLLQYNKTELVMGYRRIMKILPYKRVFIMTLLLSLVLMVFLWNSDRASEQELREVTESIELKKVKIKICAVNFEDNRDFIKNNPNLTMIYFVTPTYPRPEQTPELTRLSHTLMHIPRIHWIVADDHSLCSSQVLNMLRRTGLPFTHISSPKPFTYLEKNYPRGVTNRRAALRWIRNNVQSGVLYFGDDDNTVDLDLFEEIRSTKKVSMFPVGLIGEYGVSSPVVRNGNVVGFFDSWPAYRTFPVDMAGFAVSVDYLKVTAEMPYKVGHQEDKFLVSLGLKMNDIQPLANNCSRILVWHTQTKKHNKSTINITLEMLNKLDNTDNLSNLLKETTRLGMATLDKRGIKAQISRNRGLTLVPWEKVRSLDARCVSTFAASHLARSTLEAGAAAEWQANQKGLYIHYTDDTPTEAKAFIRELGRGACDEMVVIPVLPGHI